MLKAAILSGRSITRNLSAYVHKKIDPVQEAALNESCILVNENDIVVGEASKYSCHRVQSDGTILLHRGFSVFIFNSKNELLLQKRSDNKVNFPGCYTNSCCSHPLYNIESEREEKNAFGIRLAAYRRLNYELGIPPHEIHPDHLQYLTRIHYKSTGDGVWGEHEIDYILFLQKDVTLKPNPNEVSSCHYISRSDFDGFLSNLDCPITPWFKLIVENKLHLWWDNLHQLFKYENHDTIHRFVKE